MKNILLFTALVTILAGCSINITKEGNKVRLVSEKERDSCSFIGVVTGSMSMGANTGHDSESAMNEARNKVAAIGGNGMRILGSDSDVFASTVTAEALHCNFEKNIKPNKTNTHPEVSTPPI